MVNPLPSSIVPPAPATPPRPTAPARAAGDGLEGAAEWFDGKTSHKRSVTVLLVGDVLRVLPERGASSITGDDATASTTPLRFRLRELRVGEPWFDAPLPVDLPDGGTLWLGDEARSVAMAVVERSRTLRRRTRRLPWPEVARIIDSWPAVFACLIAAIALVVWFDRQGAAVAAGAVLVVLPHKIDEKVGDAAEATVKTQWLAPSKLATERQQRLRRRFEAVAADVAPGQAVKLAFHREKGMRARSTEGGGNGDGTPTSRSGGGGGTASPEEQVSRPAPAPRARGDEGDHGDGDDDDEVDRRDVRGQASPASSGATGHERAPAGAPRTEPTPRIDPRGGFNAFALPNGTIVVLDGLANSLSDDEVMAVLGHELGHVVHRHGMKGVMRSVGLLTVAGAVFGEFSTVLASTVASLQTFHYGRDDEREADLYGRRFAEAARLPAGTEAAMWRKLRAAEKRLGVDGLPAWMSTHPSTEERLRAAETREGAP